jgi:hypothetical protein
MVGLLVSAIMWVTDASFLEVTGRRALANWGFFSGAVVIAIAVGFADWSQPKAPPAR